MNIDKEIQEYQQKLEQGKIGFTKTLQEYSKDKSLMNLYNRQAYSKLSFNTFRNISIQDHIKSSQTQDGQTNSKVSYTHICWGGESSSYPNQIAASTTNGVAYIYNIQKKGVVQEINFTNSELNTCSIEPSENNLLAAGGFDGGIYVSNINNLKNKDKKDETEEIKKFSGHQGVVNCCKFLNATYLVSSSNDSVIHLWDINSQGKSINSYHDHSNEVGGLDVNEQNGNFFATGSGDTTVKLWDIREKKACVCTFKGSDSSVSCVKFLPGRYTTLAAGSEDSLIRIYDLRALKELALLKQKADCNNSISSLCFSKSGQLLFASSSKSYTISIWDIFNDSNEPVAIYNDSKEKQKSVEDIKKKGISQISIDSSGSKIGYITDSMINIIR
jgi:WD40 repeat protein